MKTRLSIYGGLLALALLAGCAAPQQQQGVSISQTSRGVEISSSDSILFDSGKYEINSGGGVFLDRVADLLKNKTRNSVIIEGHTDNVGRADYNQELSELRALSVAKALVDRGVSKTRMKAQGYGASRPVADNGSEAGRRRNRRTDIIILGEKKENLGNDPFADLVGKIKNLFQ
ncbi:OmpA family protein [uncultured Aquitalea sp.]|uniref:OmpA family protein n=1 Tax=uncultured Aquitalea sp. TaxID=540272 RepID=UPI0025DC71C9|nr:OmpA family protein [uncultured Aquitalea sp.]